MRIGPCEVWVEGAGEPAVLIHGFPLDGRMWTGQVPLSDRFRVIVPDLRGHGNSAPQGDDVHTMDLLADDVARVITEFGPHAHVTGLSMGGYVALALWERHPQVVSSLTLVDTRAAADTEDGKAGRRATAAAVVEHGRGPLFEQLIGKLVAPDCPLPVKARLRSMIEDQPVEGIVADLYGMAARPDRSGLLAGVDVPVTAIVGEHDAITPPAESERMAADADGELVVIDGAGHMSPMEAPEQVNRALAAAWTR